MTQFLTVLGDLPWQSHYFCNLGSGGFSNVHFPPHHLGGPMFHPESWFPWYRKPTKPCSFSHTLIMSFYSNFERFLHSNNLIRQVREEKCLAGNGQRNNVQPREGL